MRKKLFGSILDIVIILLIILILFWFIQLFFGGSPTLTEFNFTLILMIAGFLIKLYREMGEVKVELKHLSSDVKEGFSRVREDTRELKEMVK
jgi:hypothetical protein